MSNKEYIAALTSKFAQTREKQSGLVFTNQDTVVPTSLLEPNPYNNSIFNLYRSMADPSILSDDYMYYQSDGGLGKTTFQNLGDAAASYTLGRGAGNLANRLYLSNLHKNLGLSPSASLLSNMQTNPTGTAELLGLGKGGFTAATGTPAGANNRTPLNSWGPLNFMSDFGEMLRRRNLSMPSNAVAAGTDPVVAPTALHSNNTAPAGGNLTQVQQAFRAAAELRNANTGQPPTTITAPQPAPITSLGKPPKGGGAPPMNTSPATDWSRVQYGANTPTNATGNTVLVQPKSGPVVDFISSRIPGGNALAPSVREVAPTEALNSRLNANRSRWEGRGGLTGLGLLLGRNLLNFGSPVAPASTGISYDEYGNLTPASAAKVERSQNAQ